MAAIGQGTAKDVEIIINIVTDTETFTDAAAAAAASDTHVNGTVDADESETTAVDDATVDDASDDDTTGVSGVSDVSDVSDASDDAIGDESPDVQPSEPPPAAATPKVPRRFCHTLDGIEINPLAALQAALDGHIRAIVVGDDGVIINQGRKQRLFTGNARVAAQIQAGLDNLTRCPYPGCRATPRHIDHATEWASPDAGRTDVANSNIPCAHHNLWKSKHHYTVHRDQHGNLRTHRPDGTELHPY